MESVASSVQRNTPHLCCDAHTRNVLLGELLHASEQQRIELLLRGNYHNASWVELQAHLLRQFTRSEDEPNLAAVPLKWIEDVEVEMTRRERVADKLAESLQRRHETDIRTQQNHLQRIIISKEKEIVKLQLAFRKQSNSHHDVNILSKSEIELQKELRVDQPRFTADATVKDGRTAWHREKDLLLAQCEVTRTHEELLVLKMECLAAKDELMKTKEHVSFLERVARGSHGEDGDEAAVAPLEHVDCQSRLKMTEDTRRTLAELRLRFTSEMATWAEEKAGYQRELSQRTTQCASMEKYIKERDEYVLQLSRQISQQELTLEETLKKMRELDRVCLELQSAIQNKSSTTSTVHKKDALNCIVDNVIDWEAGGTCQHLNPSTLIGGSRSASAQSTRTQPGSATRPSNRPRTACNQLSRGGPIVTRVDCLEGIQEDDEESETAMQLDVKSSATEEHLLQMGSTTVQLLDSLHETDCLRCVVAEVPSRTQPSLHQEGLDEPFQKLRNELWPSPTTKVLDIESQNVAQDVKRREEYTDSMRDHHHSRHAVEVVTPSPSHLKEAALSTEIHEVMAGQFRAATPIPSPRTRLHNDGREMLRASVMLGSGFKVIHKTPQRPATARTSRSAGGSYMQQHLSARGTLFRPQSAARGMDGVVLRNSDTLTHSNNMSTGCSAVKKHLVDGNKKVRHNTSSSWKSIAPVKFSNSDEANVAISSYCSVL